MGVIFWRRLDRARRDDGFSLIEAVVGMGIFGVVMMMLAGMLAGGLRGVHFSKQRTAATADANELLEQSRSLAFTDVGLVSSDATLASDSRITGTCPSSCTFNGEPIVFATNTTSHPFNPHQQTNVQRSPVTLTRSIYVTGSDTNADGRYDLKRVTIIVSWERAALSGAANSVTVTTVISPNSPGTPGNPLQCSGSSCYPPIGGYAATSAGIVFVESETGGGADLEDSSSGPEPVTLRVVNVNGTGKNELNANSTVSCSQQQQLLNGLHSTAGTSASASADSITRPGPFTETKNQSEPIPDVVASPLSMTTASLTGTATCTASGVTNSSTLPSESGSSSVSSTASALSTDQLGLVQQAGSFAPVELSGLAASQSIAQNTPAAKQVDVSSTHTLTDLQLLRQFGLSVPGVIDLGMPEGLVHVAAYSATATASASALGGTQGITADATKPLTIKIWDNGASDLTDAQGNTIICASRSGNYCVLTPTTNDAFTVNETRTLCVPVLVCTITVTVDIFVRVNAASAQPTTLADNITKVYKAEYAPVNVTARLRLGNNASGSYLMDVRATADLGRVASCAKHGIYPGGC